ncbi:MAG: DUF1499 domain-containing protein [Nitrospinae bacterium]|nr:DUF1499 domain-containing protein [Nitrospinota bacterium]
MFKGNRPKNLGVKDGRLAECPGSPNCVCSQDTKEKETIAPLVYTVSLEEAKKVLKDVVDLQTLSEIIEEKDDYLYAEFTSSLLGFVDDVEFYFPQNEKLIHVRSSSRLGHYDFGANRKRVEAIRAEFSQRVGELQKNV